MFIVTVEAETMKKKSQRYKAAEKLAKKAVDTSTKSLDKIGSHAKKVARKSPKYNYICFHKNLKLIN